MSSRGDAALEHLSVLIADDDATFRRGLREGLRAEGLVVVGEADDVASTIRAVTRLQPSICLLELSLPGDGLTAIARIAKAAPETLIVVLTRSNRSEDVVTALTRGASGYLLKGLSNDRLAATLRGAYEGEPAVSRSLVPYLVDEIRRGSYRRVALPDRTVTLTPREWEVGELLRDGLSTTEIADRLGVSPVTVRRHVGLLLRKLHARSREDAVAILRAHARP